MSAPLVPLRRQARETLCQLRDGIRLWALRSKALDDTFKAIATEIKEIDAGRGRTDYFSAAWWHQFRIPGDDLPRPLPSEVRPNLRHPIWIATARRMLQAAASPSTPELNQPLLNSLNKSVHNTFTELWGNVIQKHAPDFASSVPASLLQEGAPWVHKLALLLQLDAIVPLAPDLEGPLALRMFPAAVRHIDKEEAIFLQTLDFRSTLQAVPGTSGQSLLRMEADYRWTFEPVDRAAHTLLVLAIVAHSPNPVFRQRVARCFEHWRQHPLTTMTWPYDEWIYDAPSKSEAKVEPMDEDEAMRRAIAMSLEQASKRPAPIASASMVRPTKKPAHALGDGMDTFDDEDYRLALRLSAEEASRKRPFEASGAASSSSRPPPALRSQPIDLDEEDEPDEAAVLQRAMAMSRQQRSPVRVVDEDADLRLAMAMSMDMDATPLERAPAASSGLRMSPPHIEDASDDDDDDADGKQLMATEAQQMIVSAANPRGRGNFVYQGVNIEEALRGLFEGKQVVTLDNLPLDTDEDNLQEIAAPGAVIRLNEDMAKKRRNYYLRIKDRVPPEAKDFISYTRLRQAELERELPNTEIQAGIFEIPFVDVSRAALAPLGDDDDEDPPLRFRMDGLRRLNQRDNAQLAVKIIHMRRQLAVSMKKLEAELKAFNDPKLSSIDVRALYPNAAANMLVLRNLASDIFQQRTLLALNGEPRVLADPAFFQPFVRDDPAYPILVDPDAETYAERRNELEFQHKFKDTVVVLPHYAADLVYSICELRFIALDQKEQLDAFDKDLLNYVRRKASEGVAGQLDLEPHRKARGRMIDALTETVMELSYLRATADRLQIAWAFTRPNVIEAYTKQLHMHFSEQIAKKVVVDDEDIDPTLPVQSVARVVSYELLGADGKEVFVEEDVQTLVNEIFMAILPEDTPVGPTLLNPFTEHYDDAMLIYSREIFAKSAEVFFERGFLVKREYAEPSSTAVYNLIENRAYSTLSDRERQVVDSIHACYALYSQRPSRALFFEATHRRAWDIRLKAIELKRQASTEQKTREEKRNADIVEAAERLNAKYNIRPDVRRRTEDINWGPVVNQLRPEDDFQRTRWTDYELKIWDDFEVNPEQLEVHLQNLESKPVKTGARRDGTDIIEYHATTATDVPNRALLERYFLEASPILTAFRHMVARKHDEDAEEKDDELNPNDIDNPRVRQKILQGPVESIEVKIGHMDKLAQSIPNARPLHPASREQVLLQSERYWAAKERAHVLHRQASLPRSLMPLGPVPELPRLGPAP